MTDGTQGTDAARLDRIEKHLTRSEQLEARHWERAYHIAKQSESDLVASARAQGRYQLAREIYWMAWSTAFFLVGIIVGTVIGKMWLGE